MDKETDGVWQYKASWRSNVGTMTLAMLFFGLLFLLAALASRRQAPSNSSPPCAGGTTPRWR